LFLLIWIVQGSEATNTQHEKIQTLRGTNGFGSSVVLAVFLHQVALDMTLKLNLQVRWLLFKDKSQWDKIEAYLQESWDTWLKTK
jgi:hypothetical protein